MEMDIVPGDRREISSLTLLSIVREPRRRVLPLEVKSPLEAEFLVQQVDHVLDPVAGCAGL